MTKEQPNLKVNLYLFTLNQVIYGSMIVDANIHYVSVSLSLNSSAQLAWLGFMTEWWCQGLTVKMINEVLQQLQDHSRIILHSYAWGACISDVIPNSDNIIINDRESDRSSSDCYTVLLGHHWSCNICSTFSF